VDQAQPDGRTAVPDGVRDEFTHHEFGRERRLVQAPEVQLFDGVLSCPCYQGRGRGNVPGRDLGGGEALGAGQQESHVVSRTVRGQQGSYDILARLIQRTGGSCSQALLAALGDSLLPVLDAVGPALEEAAEALGELVEATSPLLPAAAGLAAGTLLALTPLIRAAADVLEDSSPELRRTADALTAALAPILPLQIALAERAAAAGAGVVRATLPPLADLTEAAAAGIKAGRPLLIAGEEFLVSSLEHLQPLLLASASRAGRVARAAAVRVSAAVSPAAERGVVVAVHPV
jgi:hypothetical protein